VKSKDGKPLGEIRGEPGTSGTGERPHNILNMNLIDLKIKYYVWRIKTFDIFSIIFSKIHKFCFWNRFFWKNWLKKNDDFFRFQNMNSPLLTLVSLLFSLVSHFLRS
jgi:hypothetical protein